MTSFAQEARSLWQDFLNAFKAPAAQLDARLHAQEAANVANLEAQLNVAGANFNTVVTNFISGEIAKFPEVVLVWNVAKGGFEALLTKYETAGAADVPKFYNELLAYVDPILLNA